MSMKNKGFNLAPNKYGIYEVRWSENGRSKRLSTKTGDAGKAHEFLDNLKADLEERLETPKYSCGITVPECVNFYIQNYCVGQVADVERQRICGKHIKGFFNVRVCDITPELVNQYIASRNVEKSTVRRELVVLRAALNYCVKYKKLTDFPHIEMPEHAEAKRIWLTNNQADFLFKLARKDVADRSIALFICVALETAARKQSILDLKWSQIDVGNKMIHFDNNGENQTNKRKVPVPISDRLYTVIMSLWKNSINVEYVFTETARKNFHNLWNNYISNIIPPEEDDVWLKLTPHCLRKTWATLAAQAGVDMFAIAGVLGDDIKTVYKNYAFHSPEHLRSAINFRK